MRMRHLSLALIVVALLMFRSVEARDLKIVSYTVNAGDTMDSVAQMYLPPDRDNSPQALAEFKEGIFEYNYDNVFSGRSPYELRAGDCLFITFWE